MLMKPIVLCAVLAVVALPCLAQAQTTMPQAWGSIWRREAIKRVARTNLTPAMLAGGMQVGAYWIAIWALAHAPMGMVSALRETSVLFAALISTFILKEGFGVWRFVSVGLIACGIGLTRYKP